MNFLTPSPWFYVHVTDDEKVLAEKDLEWYKKNFSAVTEQILGTTEPPRKKRAQNKVIS